MLPAGASNANSFGYSVHAQILQHIEQENLGKQFDLRQPLFVGVFPTPSFQLNPEAAVAAGTAVKTFLCPGEGQSPLFTVNSGGGTHAGTNYVINLGSGLAGPGAASPNGYDTRFPSDGVFHYGPGVKLTDISDGTSNTMVMSQCLLGLNVKARSNFPGGVCVCLGDGRVRFVRDAISLATWRAMATRGGGAVASDN